MIKHLLLFTLLTFTSNSSLAQEWELLTPIKTNDRVGNCSFSDAQHGAAITEVDGVVLLTENGGDSWYRPWTPGIPSNLNDVVRIGLDTVLICGPNGEVFRTIDQGSSWQEMNVPTNSYLYNFYFIDSMVGFIAAHSGEILKTIDGGTSWTVIDTGIIYRIYDIEFPTPTVGYACSRYGVILKTTDAGETWTEIQTPYDNSLLGISAPSENVVYACGFGQNIVGSSDGGETFELQHTGSATAALNYIEFKNDTQGWAAGDWGGYFTTTNGGSTWVSSNETGDDFIYGGQYLDENTAFLTGKGIIRKSSDGGDNWEVLTTSVPNANYNAVYFFDDNHGYAAGSTGSGSATNSGIAYTENGGATWETQFTGFTGGWIDIHFADENIGTAIGSSQFAKTTNGGDTWITSSLPDDIGGRATHWFSASEGLIGGADILNGICKTNNGGSTYSCDYSKLANDFFFINDQLGYAVSESGGENIFRTEDGGETWDYVSIGGNSLKHSVYFLDEINGWVGRANGAVSRTLNGGDDWETFFVTGSGNIVGVHFYDENIGFCVTHTGYVYKSEDGGESWESVLQGDDNTLTTMTEGFFTENYLYVSALGGDVYRCELGCGSIAEPQVLAQTEWCQNETNFVGFNSTAVVSEFSWTLPEGWTSDTQNSVISLTSGNEDGVIGLEITNSCGLTASTEHSVTVIPTPQEIESLLVQDFVCANGPIEVLVEFPNPDVTYEWEYPPYWSITENDNVLQITLNDESGAISVVASNQCGQSAEFTEIITVPTPTEVSFTEEFEPLCNNGVYYLEPGSPDGGTFYGEYVSSDQSLDLTLAEAGLTQIEYHFYDENGCLATATEEITILESELTGGLDVELAEPCGGLLVISANTLLNATDFSLEAPDYWGEITVFPGGLITQTWDDVYDSGVIEITFTNDCGSELYQAYEVEVIQEPSIPQLFENSSPWCFGSGGELEVHIGENDSLIVNSPELDFIISNVDDELLLNLSGAPGSYSVTLSSENICGTSQDTLVDVEILELPEVSLMFENDTLCTEAIYPAIVNPEGGTLEGLAVSGMGIETYFLNPGETYDYLYTYIDENGCTGTDSAQVFMEVCTSVSELNDLNFSIYPNPTANEITLECELIGEKYFLYNSAGELIKKDRISSSLTVLSLGELPAGVYSLVIRDSILRVGKY